MNIIIVTDYASIVGGASKVALTSAIALAREGLKVSVFAGAGPVWDQLPLNQIDVQCLGHVHFKDQGSGGAIHGIWDKDTGQAFGAMLSRHSVDDTVVHVHSFRDVLSPSIFPPLFDRKFATVYTAHDYGLACPYGGFYDFTRSRICPKTGGSMDCLKTRCNGGSYGKKLWFFGKHLVQRSFGEVPKELKHAVFVSPFSLRVLDPYFPQTCQRHTVDNPIEIAQQPRRQLQPDAPFVYVGALVEHKDPLILARAAHELQVPAIFVGDGPLKDVIKAACPHAQVTGWMKPEAVRDYLRESRALVFPSVWYEGQPLTVLEALADGVPVICSDANAGREEVIATKGGILFPSRNENVLQEAMMRLLETTTNEDLSTKAYDGYWSRPRTMAAHLSTLRPVYEQALMGVR